MCIITCRQGGLHVCLPLLSSSDPSCNSINQGRLPYIDQSMTDMHATPDVMLRLLQVKDDETVTVGQVLAKIAAGEAPSQPAGQEDASAGAAPAEATALDAETTPDSGISQTEPYIPALRCIRPTRTYTGMAGQSAHLR